MRTALISDVHGNAVALDAVLADLERDPVDQVVCLGDMIQGGSQPAEVVRLLRELACPVVLGNADAFLLDPDAGEEEKTERQLAVREWTLAQIGDDGAAFIETFRPTLDVPLGEERTLLAFHGSPTSFDDIVLPHLEEDEFRRLLGPPAADVLAGGHVHLQWLRRYGDSTFVNPGSVGLAYDHAQPDDATTCASTPSRSTRGSTSTATGCRSRSAASRSTATPCSLRSTRAACRTPTICARAWRW